MARKRFEVSDSVDSSNRLVRTRCSTADRAECRRAMGPLQLVKCFRAVFKMGQRLVGWRSSRSDFFLLNERLDQGGLISGVGQSTYCTGYQDCVSHRLRAQLGGAHVFRTAGQRSKIVLLARNLCQAGRVVEGMQCACEPLLLVVRFGWAARLGYEFSRLTQRIAGRCC